MAGLAAENPADTILTRALASMVVCHVVGWCVGTAAERTAQDAIAEYALKRTIPPGAAVPSGGGGVKPVEEVLIV